MGRLAPHGKLREIFKARTPAPWGNPCGDRERRHTAGRPARKAGIPAAKSHRDAPRLQYVRPVARYRPYSAFPSVTMPA